MGKRKSLQDRRKPVLIIQHAPSEHPAALRRALETQGIASLWIHPYKGAGYPRTLASIRGLISMGGPMGANDEIDHPWIEEECRLLQKCIEKGLPTVGICLGGQMMAKAMGGEVTRNTTPEVGWFPIEINTEGKTDPITSVSGPSPLVYHWHQDTFHLPQGAKLLAQSTSCPRQAFRVGEKAYGFQFHPEADHQLIQEWLATEEAKHEVHQIRKKHGSHTVQDVETQIQNAREGEKASLQITAAIGQLFKDRPYEPIDTQTHEHLENWSTLQTPILVEFEGSDRKTHTLKGKIALLLTIPEGEFVIFQEESTLLWPIRMDFLTKAAVA